MSHANHPSIKAAGLADDCARCAEHAANPMSELDAGNLRELVERTLGSRFGGPESPFGRHAYGRTETEGVAMANVMTTLERTGKLFEVAPDIVALYLRTRWRVPVEIGGPS